MGVCRTSASLCDSSSLPDMDQMFARCTSAVSAQVRLAACGKSVRGLLGDRPRDCRAAHIIPPDDKPARNTDFKVNRSCLPGRRRRWVRPSFHCPGTSYSYRYKHRCRQCSDWGFSDWPIPSPILLPFVTWPSILGRKRKKGGAEKRRRRAGRDSLTPKQRHNCEINWGHPAGGTIGTYRSPAPRPVWSLPCFRPHFTGGGHLVFAPLTQHGAACGLSPVQVSRKRRGKRDVMGCRDTSSFYNRGSSRRSCMRFGNKPPIPKRTPSTHGTER